MFSFSDDCRREFVRDRWAVNVSDFGTVVCNDKGRICILEKFLIKSTLNEHIILCANVPPALCWSSSHTSVLSPPLASIFLSLERLCPLRTELQQEYDRASQQWLRALLSVWRFPPETIYGRGWSFCWQLAAAGKMLPAGVLYIITRCWLRRQGASSGDSRCDGAWCYCRRRYGGSRFMSMYHHQSVTEPQRRSWQQQSTLW